MTHIEEMQPDPERFLIRITGKGVTFKRRVPGWLAAMVIRVLARHSDA